MTTIHWKVIDSIYGHMSRQECEWIAQQAATAESWTEVGVYIGRSAMCVALHLPQRARLQLVDRQLGSHVEAAGSQRFFGVFEQIKQRRPDLQLLLAKMDSVGAARLLPAADVVFLDSDHGYEHLLAEIPAWQAKCTRLLCGHDYGQEGYPGVKQAVDEILGPVEVTGTIWSRGRLAPAGHGTGYQPHWHV